MTGTELTINLARRHDLDEAAWQREARRFIESWADFCDLGDVENVEIVEDVAAAFQYPNLYDDSTPYVIRATASGRGRMSSFNIEARTFLEEPGEIDTDHLKWRKPFIAGGMLVTVGTAARMVSQSVSWWDIAGLSIVLLVLLTLYREA